jgi:hypothetical protein
MLILIACEVGGEGRLFSVYMVCTGIEYGHWDRYLFVKVAPRKANPSMVTADSPSVASKGAFSSLALYIGSSIMREMKS